MANVLVAMTGVSQHFGQCVGDIIRGQPRNRRGCRSMPAARSGHGLDTEPRRRQYSKTSLAPASAAMAPKRSSVRRCGQVGSARRRKPAYRQPKKPRDESPRPCGYASSTRWPARTHGLQASPDGAGTSIKLPVGQHGIIRPAIEQVNECGWSERSRGVATEKRRPGHGRLFQIEVNFFLKRHCNCPSQSHPQGALSMAMDLSPLAGRSVPVQTNSLPGATWRLMPDLD